MRFISTIIGYTILVTFLMGDVPPNMLTNDFNVQYVKPGSSAQESCEAGGVPKPTYIWKKDGNVLSSDANYEINPNTGVIKIKSVTVVNGEGTYQCLAENSQGTALSGFWEVRVASLTGFDQARTSNPMVNEYSYFSMPCEHQPSSVPASKLDWLVGAGDNTAFPTTPEDKRRIVIDADGTLHFLYVRASDNTNNPYRCQLFNSVVSIKAVSLEKFNLNVVKVPEVTSKPILKYSKSVEGTIGSKATLLCIFAGNPIPDVEWFKDGTKLPDTSFLPDGTPRFRTDPEDPTGRKLIILKLEIKDEGAYICRATNSYGMNEGTVRVTVTGAPQWITGPLKSTRVPVGATAKFQCDTISYHATSSLPMWMKNGVPIIGCPVKKFWCGDGTGCYDYNKKCDNRNDCPNTPSADEQNCPALDTCAEGQFSCEGGECKTASEVIRCDGIPQCLNGGDESVRHCGCKVNTDLMCADLKKCISVSERCNKHADCADGSDETRCAYNPEKVIGSNLHFSADLRQLTIPNVKKTDTMCLQCLVHNFRDYGPNPKPDIVGITFGDACLTVLDPINILSGFPEKQKVQPGDIINFTISAQTDPLEQGNLRYDWYIGGKRYPDNFPIGTWSHIIRLNMGNRHIEIDTSTLKSHDDRLFQALMGNLSVRVYHNFDERIISTELYTEIIYPSPAPVIVAELDLWYIALIIGILILFIIVALIICYLHRNRGGNYPVDKKEHQAGHDPEQELKDSGFHDVGRVNDSYDDEKPPKDDISLPESVNYDSDDMTEEYGGDFDVSKFNEDGSFIGLYGEKRGGGGGKGGNKPMPPSQSEV
ncbi:hypothetical protein CHS0354_003475 [Potamilus streckersoni]|uniref:Ig-like domain-containing protein n=1 Tax=Potamilus streckersoni TaxID=2493646 RepID=A0AAE0W2M3_9BIVA|nr:hypothetical protein CHS0354_003475 [Potamilus streckersoni]